MGSPVDDHGEGTTLDNPVLYQREARPVDDALDRLDSQTVYDYQSRHKDAATVRSAMEQLREERDAARREADYQVRQANQILVRARAAEAEVRRLDDLRALYLKEADRWSKEANRLMKGLRNLKSTLAFEKDGEWYVVGPGAGLQIKAVEKIDALLSDSPPKKWPEGDAAWICERHPEGPVEGCGLCRTASTRNAEAASPDGGGAK